MADELGPAPRPVGEEESTEADASIKTNAKREKRPLDLRKETWQMLENLRRSFQHEDLEETVVTLVDVGTKMVTLTTPHDRMVKMFGGERREVSPPCPSCNQKRTSYERETSVKLGQELPKPKSGTASA